MLKKISSAAADPILRPQMPELDTLRGIAVSMVVLYHCFGFGYGVTGLSGIPKVLVALTIPGWAGVNLFFVLSGFLITGILLDTKARPDYYRRFYFRRALRILPLYYGLLVVLAVLMRSHASWGFLGVSAIYMANMTALFGVPNQFKALWSLAVEEHFYLLWPSAIRTLSRRRVIVCAIAIAGVCLFLRVVYYALGIGGTLQYTWLRADGLAFGAVLAAVARSDVASRRAVRKFARVTCAIGLGLFVLGAPFGIFVFDRFLCRTLRETALDLCFASILATVLLLGTSKWKAVVNLRSLQFLGRISYGIYLTHMLVFGMVLDFIGRHYPGWANATGHFEIMVLQFCVTAVLTLVLSYLSRRYFEEWFLQLKDRKPAAMISDERTVAELDPAPAA